MFSQQPIGPRVVAASETTVAWLPEQTVLPAFTSPGGVRYLATEASAVRLRSAGPPSFSLVEELITRPPLVIDPRATAGEAARAMSEAGHDYAAVALGAGRYGLITDRRLRKAVLQADRPASVPVSELLDPDPPTALVGDSAAEAMIALLDRRADVVLILDRAGRVARRGRHPGLRPLPDHRRRRPARTAAARRQPLRADRAGREDARRPR